MLTHQSIPLGDTIVPFDYQPAFTPGPSITSPFAVELVTRVGHDAGLRSHAPTQHLGKGIVIGQLLLQDQEPGVPVIEVKDSKAPNGGKVRFLGSQVMWRPINSQAANHFRAVDDIEAPPEPSHTLSPAEYAQIPRIEKIAPQDILLALESAA